MNNFNKFAKYYKIIGANLYGKYPYKLGLNTLADNGEIFDETPTCGPGGLYFCDIKHIFKYIYHGDKICVLNIPDNAQVIEVEDKYKADQIYIDKIMEINYDTIKYLVDNGADITVAYSFPRIYGIGSGCDTISKYNHILFRASENGHLEIIKYLVEHKDGITKGKNDGIRSASEYGHFEIVKYLVEHGGDVTAFDNSAISLAVSNGHLKIVKYLIEHGADVVHPVNNNNHMICSAACKGYLEIVKLLAEHGADITAYDNEAICDAAKNGHLKIVKYLAEHGADVTAKYNSAINWAAWYGHLEIVKCLTEYGARTKFAINNAACGGHLEVVKYLAEYGVWSDDAILCASDYNYPEIVNYLSKYEANYITENNCTIL